MPRAMRVCPLCPGRYTLLAANKAKYWAAKTRFVPSPRDSSVGFQYRQAEYLLLYTGSGSDTTWILEQTPLTYDLS